jgi:fatty acid desaturase
VTVKNVDPLHHRVWVAMRYSVAFKVCMVVGLLCWIGALVIALKWWPALWAFWACAVLFLTGIEFAAHGWRKGAI